MRAFKWPSKKACAVLLAVECLIGGPSLMPGSAAQRFAVALLRDPLAIFADRSPGARESGALTQSKLARAAQNLPRRSASLPREADRIERALPAATPALPAFGLAPSEMPLIPADDIPLVPSVGGIAFGESPGGVSSGGGFFPTGGGGGGGGYYDVPPTIPGGGDGSPPGSVPEPATWLTTIFGLAAVGAVLRRRRVNLRIVPQPYATR